MEVLFNENIPRALWLELLKNNPHSTPFQSPEWYDFVESVKNMSAEAIAISENSSVRALAVITIQKENGIKGYFSRRGIIFGGPLLDINTNVNECLLKNIITKLKDNAIYIESRNLSDYDAHKETFPKNGFSFVPWLNFQLDTLDQQTVFSGMSNSRLRQIKKAIRNDVSWREAANTYEVDSFFSILSDLYRNKVGKPLPQLEFFRNFYETKLGKYLLVFYGEKIIGGIMCPILDKRAIYEFYVCGLDEEYKEQYPSVMATWAGIDYACSNNIPVFDFMGAGQPEESYGVREFKSRFGGTLVEFGRFIKINNPFLYEIGKLGLKTSKKFTW